MDSNQKEPLIKRLVRLVELKAKGLRLVVTQKDNVIYPDFAKGKKKDVKP